MLTLRFIKVTYGYVKKAEAIFGFCLVIIKL